MESDEVFLTGDSRGDSEIKRGTGCRAGMQVELSGVSAHTRALPQAFRAAWEWEISCPRSDSSQTPRDAGQHSPLRKVCGHRRLRPGAPHSRLSVFCKRSHFIPTHPQGPHSPGGQTKRKRASQVLTNEGSSQLIPRSVCRQSPFLEVNFFEMLFTYYKRHMSCAYSFIHFDMCTVRMLPS